MFHSVQNEYFAIKGSFSLEIYFVSLLSKILIKLLVPSLNDISFEFTQIINFVPNTLKLRQDNIVLYRY